MVDDQGFWHNKHILITAGPTRERIDPVRYLTNDSSGKQGYAIASVLLDYGATVTLVSGPVALATPKGACCILVESAQEMADVVMEHVTGRDAAICVAAVADWRPKEYHPQKIKKQSSVDEMSIQFIKNPDILKQIAQTNDRPQCVVGFAAETEDVIVRAQHKREDKQCDILVANHVGAGVFGSDENTVHIIDEHGVTSLGRLSKHDVARHLIDKVRVFLDKNIKSD